MWSFWGKAGARQEFHPLPYHQLDVAAIGVRLLERHVQLRARLIELSGLPDKLGDCWIPFFLAIHDLGKFSSVFQLIRPDLAPAHARKLQCNLRHDTMGHVLWRKQISARLIDSGSLARFESDPVDLEEILDQWFQAVTGHHGQPPKTSNEPLAACFAPEDVQAANEYLDSIYSIFFPAKPPVLPENLDEINRHARVFSWWLAGFAVLADWLGSNRAYFLYHQVEMSLADYWQEIALPSADRAIDGSGLLPNQPANGLDLCSLFPEIHQPTQLQSACEQVPLHDGPQLFVLEDVTGSGKTEAAFALLHRLLAAGLGQGAYFALPTMATSNAMYRRTSKVYRTLFREEQEPSSLVLAHGSRHLDDRFRDSILASSPDRGGEYEPGELDAGARCNAWLADGSKKALLAQMGVGTIDQALLAILTSRHQSLRLFGLLDKVLIVDEVHASDAYMHRLLCFLLEFHARSCGSAILLSATLPNRMRQELADAFLRGLESKPQALAGTGYPLLTQVGIQSPLELEVETWQKTGGTLEFEMFHDESDVVGWIIDRTKVGQCIAWIRNTVSDAIEAYQALAVHLPDDRLELFHARFAMADRLAIEDRVVARFGPESASAQRSGRVLVATQVIEQSLDLDFDCMVSDLAPIDLLLQRAGRLRRHSRDQAGNRTDGVDARGPVTLHVLGPDPDIETDEHWFARLLRGAAAVYPDHGQLWLTARLIKDCGSVAIPGDLREWIEGVFSESPVAEVPEALISTSIKVNGQRRSEASLATFNAIRIEGGYQHEGGDWWDESHTPTRLGEPTIVVRLARWDGESLTPWSDSERNPWPMSEIRLRRALVAEASEVEDSALAEAISQVRESWTKAATYICLLPLVQKNGSWVGRGRNETGRNVEVAYDPDAGLRVRRLE